MALPPALLAAISAEAKSTIALVIGAGTCVEGPTSLETSAVYAREAYDSLVTHNVIAPDDCGNPEDLSCVADAVWARKKSQQELVTRLPRIAFLNAASNRGHRIAAALLREAILGAVLTLNYDRSMAHAVAYVDAGDDVVVITGPDQHTDFGGPCVIHLHRDATAPADDWILRTEQLDQAWKGRWQELMATCVAARPVVVFAGLGSPAAVLTTTVEKIRVAVKSAIIEVGPHNIGDTAFCKALDATAENHVTVGWCAFMTEVGLAVGARQVARWRTAFIAANAARPAHQQTADLIFEQLRQFDVLDLGAIRAAWLVSSADYENAEHIAPAHIAELLTAIVELQIASGLTPQIQAHDGAVEFVDPIRVRLCLFPVAAEGERRARVEERIRNSRRLMERRRREPIVAVVAAASGPVPTLPENVVAESSPDDIVSATQQVNIVDIDEFQADPNKWIAA